MRAVFREARFMQEKGRATVCVTAEPHLPAVRTISVCRVVRHEGVCLRAICVMVTATPHEHRVFLCVMRGF